MTSDDHITRRDWLRGRFFGQMSLEASEHPPGEARAPAQSARYRKAFPVLRPPGAIEEEAFLAGCTRCEACIQACPHDSIIHAPLRFRRAADTPMIDPIQQPCWMCHDYPCIAACEPNVLRLDVPVKIGSARIDVTTCLAYQGSSCNVCSEQCPVKGAIETSAGKPWIREDLCPGCGVCQHVCPAPHNAVLLMPIAERPFLPRRVTMPETPDAPLPPMSDVVLDQEQLAALFRDYGDCLNGVEILIKRGPRMVTDGSAPTLSEAEQLLRAGTARGVQIRYTHERAQWLDTLMPVAGGVRLVRIAHPIGD